MNKVYLIMIFCINLQIPQVLGMEETKYFQGTLPIDVTRLIWSKIRKATELSPLMCICRKWRDEIMLMPIWNCVVYKMYRNNGLDTCTEFIFYPKCRIDSKEVHYIMNNILLKRHSIPRVIKAYNKLLLSVEYIEDSSYYHSDEFNWRWTFKLCKLVNNFTLIELLFNQVKDIGLKKKMLKYLKYRLNHPQKKPIDDTGLKVLKKIDDAIINDKNRENH